MPDQKTAEPAVVPAKDRKKMAIAAFVLAIIAFLFSFLSLFNTPLTLVALILSIFGRKSSKKGLATAALVISIVALLIQFVLFVLISQNAKKNPRPEPTTSSRIYSTYNQ